MIINGIDKVLDVDVEKYIKELEAKVKELETKVGEFEKKAEEFEHTVEQEVKVELAKMGGWIHAKASILGKDFVGAESFVGKLFEGLGKHMQKPVAATPAAPITPVVSQPPTT